MAITVTHTKVSTIPDSGDASLIEPSDWNATHQLSGTVPVANGGTGASTLTGYVIASGTSAMTASTTIPSSAITGLGTMSTQNANNVAITGGYVNAVTINGAAIGQTTAGDGAFDILTGNVSRLNTATATTLTIGTLPYTPANALITAQSSATSYNQVIISNTNGGATASADYIVNNDLSTDTTYYGDFGMNSSGFTGTGSLSQANAVYLTSTTADLAIGTTTSNSIHFVIAGGATDAMTINTTKSVAFNGSYGTAGQVLTSGGSTGVPTWTTPTTGTVTSVSGTAGRITSTGGNTPVIDLASGIATAGTTGSSTLIPVVTIDTYGRVTSITTASNPQGTVTSVAALTLGTTGTNLSSRVATGTTTPVITLNVPTASATNRGALSAADWTTFNNKQPAGSYLTSVTADAPLSGSGTSASHLVIATANTTTTGAISSTDWNTFNGKQAALVSGTNIKTVNGTTLLGSGDLGTITYAYGGTGQTSVTTGDLLYGSATNTWSKLGIGTTGQILRVVSGAPAWGTDYTGTVTSVGGTGTVNGLTLTGTVTTSGNLTLGGTLDLSSPPAIGGTAANLITGTTITATKFLGVSGGTF